MSAVFSPDEWVVEPAWLQARLGDPELKVLDCTTVMTPQAVGPSHITSGRPQWLAAHIPGSVHACMVEDCSDPNGSFPYTLPQPEQFAAKMSQLGIGSRHHIVVVVAAQPMVATRVWWVLRAMGHVRVSILNGGLPLWRAQGYGVASGDVQPAVANFVARPQAGWSVDAEAVASAMSKPDHQVINALSEAQFSGMGGAHYGRPGHIPGSLNVPAAWMFEPDSMVWRSRDELRALFARCSVAQQGERVITYCGGGIAASVLAFALRWCGLAPAQLYDNSLLEWSADPRRPMALGQ